MSSAIEKAAIIPDLTFGQRPSTPAKTGRRWLRQAGATLLAAWLSLGVIVPDASASVISGVGGRGWERACQSFRCKELDKAGRVLVAKDIDVVDATIHRRSGGVLRDWPQKHGATLRSWTNPIMEEFSFVRGDGGDVLKIAEADCECDHFAGRFSVIADMKFEIPSQDMLIHESATSLTRRKLKDLAMRNAAARHVSAFSLASVPQLMLVDSVDSRGEPRDNSGRGSSDGRRIYNVSAVPEDDIQKVVRGAMLFLGILVGLAYLVIRRCI